MNCLLLTMCLAVGVMSPNISQSTSPDISGAWELSVTTVRGVETAAMTLKKNGDTYSGTATRDTQRATVEATVKDRTLTMTITTELSSGPATFTLAGEVAGDTMSGTGEFGARGKGTWSAKRAGTAAAADVTGTWNAEVQTAQGGGTPTFTFTQDGEKLSGQYRGTFGEAPVTGTVKDNTIVFSIDVSAQNNSVRVTYSGTVDKDTMKGTVKFGDLGQGTFTATRKK